ncbi:MAG: hypothetical protein BWY76_00253 [bacterium ADurb.Bin429]|nr:MAG: hypothetical protein BWY76_00253 [bacterium ADurb.Bin429]
MKRVHIAQLVIISVVLLIGGILFIPSPEQTAYIRRTKQELQTLAGDSGTTSARLAKLRKGTWTDGRVGITADGYVFYYAMHESHGMDNIPDTNILYLPDEKRFLITGKHFCCDLGKTMQAENKAELKGMFRWGL